MSRGKLGGMSVALVYKPTTAFETERFNIKP